jgi:hypothetical protein
VSRKLSAAVTGHGPAIARSKVMSQVTLACLEMAIGDPVQAAVIGTTAVHEAAALRPPRILDKLRELARHTTRHPKVDEVAALRQRITTGY